MTKLIYTPTQTTFEVETKVADVVATHTTTYKRRSLLYVPLVKPEFFEKLDKTQIDSVIFDLEDSIPLDKKEDARKNILCIPQKRQGVEYILRINSADSGIWKQDVEQANYKFDTFMLTKINSPEEVETITKILPKSVKRIALVETLRGWYNIRDISQVLSEGDALAFGAGDLSMELGIERSPTYENPLLTTALCDIIRAAKLQGIDVLDTPYRRFNDLATLVKECEFGKRIGVTGKQIIHPKQAESVNQVFTPTAEEVKKYFSLLSAFFADTKSHALNHDKCYEGKPTMKFTMNKLKEWFKRGYVKQ